MADTGRRAPLAQKSSAPVNDDNQAAESDATETRMRRALGLSSGGGHQTPQQRPEQARARHRFVQDGGVPVVMLSQKTEPETAQLRERISALENTLENERQSHQVTQRQLKELDNHHTALQTRLVHADLAHRDSLEQERRLRIAAQESLQEALAAAPASRRRPAVVAAAPTDDSAEPVIATGAVKPPVADVTPASPRAAAAPRAAAPTADLPTANLPGTDSPISGSDVAQPPKRGRGRPRSTTPPEPKPVRWWTPSFRAKGKS